MGRVRDAWDVLWGRAGAVRVGQGSFVMPDARVGDWARPYLGEDELNARLIELHAGGWLKEAAELLAAQRPEDVCRDCGGTGTGPGFEMQTWIDLNTSRICEACEGTGSRSKRPVWGQPLLRTRVKANDV